MNNWYVIIFIITFCIGINLPFGIWRNKQRKFSVLWFVAVHAPVPLVIMLRLLLDVKLIFIPIFIAASILGQYIGGKISKSKIDNKQ